MKYLQILLSSNVSPSVYKSSEKVYQICKYVLYLRKNKLSGSVM